MEPGAIQDFGTGTVAQRLIANNMDVGSLRTNALLRDDEWKRIDDKVLDVHRTRLLGIAHLRDAGLTVDLGGLGVLIAEYEKVSDMDPAEQSLAGITEGEEDIPEFTLAGIPIPITHKDFRVKVRHLMASRTRGQSIDVTAASIAARLVADKLEDMLFSGSSIRVGSYVIQGYTNYTDRVTGSVTATWVTTTGENIITDVNDMIGDLEAINFFGPYRIYVPIAVMANLRDDFKAASDKTTLQRIMEIEGIEGVYPTSRLTGTNIIMVQMTEDVIDLPVGQDVTTVEWDSKGGLQMHFKIMAAMAPRIKSDANSKTGIVHYS